MAKQPIQSKAKSNSQLSFFLLILGVIFLFLLTSFNFNFYLSERNTLPQEPENEVLGVQFPLEQQRAFWSDFLNQHPEYLPGWIELAEVEEKAGNTNAAKEALLKTRTIDPNYSP